MSIWDNGFVRFCRSGLGTGTDFGKAVGYTILIFAFLFILAYYAIKWIWKFCTYMKKKNAEKAAANEQKSE